MPAFLLTAPVLLIGILMYSFFPYRGLLAYFFVPMLCYIFAIIVLSKKINMWWYQRYPSKEDPELMKVINRFFPYFMRLPSNEKLRFEYRLSLFNMEMEYLTKEMPEVPPDVMVLMSSTAMQVCFGLEDFMFWNWEKVVIYRQAFHTPAIQKFHTGEIHEEDGVIILATDPFVKALKKSSMHYNMVIHQFAMAIASELKWDKEKYLILMEEEEDRVLQIKKKLAVIRNWPNRFEAEYLEVEEKELFGVCVEHFFNAPDRFFEYWPETFLALSKLLNQDPRDKQNPVLQPVATTKFSKLKDDIKSKARVSL